MKTFSLEFRLTKWENQPNYPQTPVTETQLYGVQMVYVIKIRLSICLVEIELISP